MRELEERIVRDGIVKAGNVLKVDAFLNHQCDVELFDHMGAEWARLFEGAGINKILTIEASGIGIACCASRHLDVYKRQPLSSRQMVEPFFSLNASQYARARRYVAPLLPGASKPELFIWPSAMMPPEIAPQVSDMPPMPAPNPSERANAAFSSMSSAGAKAQITDWAQLKPRA